MTQPSTPYAQRLLERLEALGQIGATPQGGVSRIAFTEADIAGRNQLIEWMEEDGLEVKVDEIGNIFGILSMGDTSANPIMIGSHLDSVTNGGKLDGPYGVLSGLEVAREIQDRAKNWGIKPVRPLVIANFTNEEGVRFQPDMVGSLVYAGGLSLEEALKAKDKDSISLGTALEESGFKGNMPIDSIQPHAFLELHIEQGPILEAENRSIGVVERLQGIYWSEISIQGQANHAGTTPMHMRRDAGLVAAELIVEAREITKDIPHQLATIGAIENRPGLLNVVPAKTVLSLDLRNPNLNLLKEAQNRIERFAKSRAENEGVDIEITPLVRFAPVEFDAGIAGQIEATCKAKGLSHKRMTSGAGHDAQMMARLCPTAMIFVPSIGGISHNPREATKEADLINGLEVLSSVATELCSH